MRKTSLVLLALAALGLAASQALAADMARPVYKAPMPPPAPIYNWTGCYIGANIGAAWGTFDVTDVNTGDTVSPSNTGFAGGGQIGCDYQMGEWVIGIRNIIDGTSISNDATWPNGGVFSGTVNSKLNWFDALTARGGFLVQPNVLLYVQAGAAWTSWNVTANDSTGVQIAELSGGNRTGWTVGGGVEWMFVPQWSLFLEYNFAGFGTRSNAGTVCVAGGGCTSDTISAKADLENILLGVNYKF